MIGDLLLTWMSETGSGAVADFRARAAWLARTENLELPERASGRWLRDVATLGHCEVDWKSGKWFMAPTVLTRLPLADGLAVLAGSRRQSVLRALDNAGVYFEDARRPGADRDLPVPRTVLVPYRTTRELEEAASAVGAMYVGCSAAGIAALLPSVPRTSSAAPPANDSRLELLTNYAPHAWASVSPKRRDLADGLYREQVVGRWRYLLRRDDVWLACDLSVGVFAELQRQRTNVIRWRPSEEKSHVGTCIVDWGAPLPPLHARALVLCSGFVPRFGSAAETVLYDNVPRSIAARIASSLGQVLQVGT